MASVLEQIRKLDEQKAALLAQAKQEAMAKAQEGIKALAELGFSYRLVQSDGSAPAPRATGSRRTGVRDDVLKVIEGAGSAGIGRAAILKEMSAESKQAQQSISNALAALKKAGTVTGDGGVYKVS
ncbi:MAG: hypothetical protein C0429_09595 [Sphingopyxis sp.]|nr:hypothetical protein [Sphingopyxis sp.]